jgi:hypothetical protein
MLPETQTVRKTSASAFMTMHTKLHMPMVPSLLLILLMQASG